MLHFDNFWLQMVVPCLVMILRTFTQLRIWTFSKPIPHKELFLFGAVINAALMWFYLFLQSDVLLTETGRATMAFGLTLGMSGLLAWDLIRIWHHYKGTPKWLDSLLVLCARLIYK